VRKEENENQEFGSRRAGERIIFRFQRNFEIIVPSMMIEGYAMMDGKVGGSRILM